MKKAEHTFKSFKYPLFILERMGLYSEKIRTRTIILYMSLIWFNLLITMMQWKYIKNNIFEIISNCEALGVFLLCLGKAGTQIYEQKAFIKLIQVTTRCWKTSRCSGKLRKDLDRLLKNNIRIQIFFYVFAAVCLLVLISGFSFGKALPLGVWKMEDSDTLRVIAYIAQTLAVLPLSFIIISVDVVFLSCCIELVIQCRLLHEEYKHLDISKIQSYESEINYNENLKKCIRHHNFILRFLKALQDYYSQISIIVYCTLSTITCSELYATFQSISIGDALNHGSTFIHAVMQLLFYALPADYVAGEIQQMSRAMYNSNWYLNYYPTLRKPLILLIQRSNQRVVFSAAGFFEVNSMSVLSVLKVAWSVCNIANAIK